jgi:hypothetical protein
MPSLTGLTSLLFRVREYAQPIGAGPISGPALIPREVCWPRTPAPSSSPGAQRVPANDRRRSDRRAPALLHSAKAGRPASRPRRSWHPQSRSLVTNPSLPRRLTALSASRLNRARRCTYRSARAKATLRNPKRDELLDGKRPAGLADHHVPMSNRSVALWCLGVNIAARARRLGFRGMTSTRRWRWARSSCVWMVRAAFAEPRAIRDQVAQQVPRFGGSVRAAGRVRLAGLSRIPLLAPPATLLELVDVLTGS